MLLWGTSLVVQWLRLRASSAGVGGLIPSWGTKIPHMVQPKDKKGGCTNIPLGPSLLSILLKGIYPEVELLIV